MCQHYFQRLTDFPGMLNVWLVGFVAGSGGIICGWTWLLGCYWVTLFEGVIALFWIILGEIIGCILIGDDVKGFINFLLHSVTFPVASHLILHCLLVSLLTTCLLLTSEVHLSFMLDVSLLRSPLGFLVRFWRRNYTFRSFPHFFLIRFSHDH